MTKLSDDPSLQTLQREVQRLLGQCLLQLQQYERLMKIIVAAHKLSAPAHAWDSVQVKRRTKIERSMLGSLVGEFLESFLFTYEKAEYRQNDINVESDVNVFSYRMQIGLSEEDFDQVKDELTGFVDLRNNLVHHFIEQHDLRDFDGCRSAQDALIAASRLIEHHFKRLREWAEDMERTRLMMRELIQSDQLRDQIVNASFNKE